MNNQQPPVNIALLIGQLDNVREQRRILDQQEAYIKKKVNLFMNENNTNQVATPTYLCTRSIRPRTSVHKEDIPPEIWDQYLRRSYYSTLSTRRI